MAGFQLHLLGPPSFARDGVPVELGRHKTIALFTYLAVTGHPHRREALATFLWPEYDQAHAAAYLRRALWSLKQVVGAEAVLTEQASIGLAAQPELWVDVHQFRHWRAASQEHTHPAESLCDRCQSTLTQAVALYRGDFLSGFTLPDCPAFDEWQFFQAERLRQELAAILEQLIQSHRSRGDFEAAITYARRQLALDALHEPAHQQLMVLYAMTGQRAAALRQYAECVRILDAELGVPPADETTQLYHTIKANQFPGATTQTVAAQPNAERIAPDQARPHDTSRHNLPAPTTSFVGRTVEVEAVRALLLRPDVRLLTLTGPGGSGKTRLALEVVAEVGAAFGDGVWFVDLAPISDPALVATAITETLGVRTSGDRPVIERLKAYLRDQSPLVILDNFEHILAAAPVVSALLAGAPKLKILVTSRALLRLRGEWDYVVPPLAAPDLHRSLALEQLAGYEAVQLFVERARTIKTSFALTQDNATAVAAICSKLDGLPLAIELAAARIRVLPAPNLLGQLNSRLGVLTGGTRDAPARQRTLRATIDWSYELLAADEQTLFRRLAVFAGGCTLEAVAFMNDERGAMNDEEVQAPDSPAAFIVRPSSFDRLESLVDNNLLIQVDGVEPRFRMLETIREYALDSLERSGEAEAVRRWHTDYFVQLTEAAEPHLYASGQHAWVQRLEAEHDNLRSALAWSIENDNTTGLRLAGALGWFWHFQGYHREGRDWLLQALDLADTNIGANSDRVRAKALNQAGYLAMWLHDLPQARFVLEQSVALWRAVGEPRGLAHALCDWGVAEFEGDLNIARAHLEESLDLFRLVADSQGLARVLLWHGFAAAFQSDFVAAQASAEESIRLGRDIGDISNIAAATGVFSYVAFLQGDYVVSQLYALEELRLHREGDDRPGIASCLGQLGTLAYLQGQYEQAALFWEERLQIWYEQDNQHAIAWSRYGLGYLALAQNNPWHAAAMFAESLTLWRALDETQGIARCLAGLVEVARASGQLERAVRLFAATQVLLDASGRQLGDSVRDPAAGYPITSQAEFEQHIAAVHAAMGDEAFEAGWAAGRAMSLAQAIAEALQPGAEG